MEVDKALTGIDASAWHIPDASVDNISSGISPADGTNVRVREITPNGILVMVHALLRR
jgi:hypothetical protein